MTFLSNPIQSVLARFAVPLATIVFCWSGLAVQATVTLLARETNGLSGVTADPFANTTTGTNMNASNLTRGLGIAAASLANAFSSDGFGTSSSSLANAQAQNDYFQITASAATGDSFSLETIEWNARFSSTGPTDMQWVYSTDNFSTSTAIGSAIARVGTTTNGNAYSVDTSAISALQDITGTLTLRFMPGALQAPLARWRLDDSLATILNSSAR